jgi:hypothetical protein
MIVDVKEGYLTESFAQTLIINRLNHVLFLNESSKKNQK